MLTMLATAVHPGPGAVFNPAACSNDCAPPSGRICQTAIPSFRPDGLLFDLAAPQPDAICFGEIGSRLSRISRFTGAGQDHGRGLTISVAQHSVMGAQALMVEGESRLTAALFLLHDAHEYAIGDMASPVNRLIAQTMEEAAPGSGEAFRSAMDRIKSAWDTAIYTAANLPVPAEWGSRTARIIKSMDARMMAAEAETLFGGASRRTLPLARYPLPRTRGIVEPWGAMKAEEEFAALFSRLAPPQRMQPAQRRVA